MFPKDDGGNHAVAKQYTGERGAGYHEAIPDTSLPERSMAYIVLVLDWAGKALSDLGDRFQKIGHAITHDPVWGGLTIGVVVLLIAFLILRARMAGN